MAWIKRPWTCAELATLERMAAAGASNAEIGKAVGRSRQAVYLRRNYKRPSDRPIDVSKAMENGLYSRAQLTKQQDEFAVAMRRAMTPSVGSDTEEKEDSHV